MSGGQFLSVTSANRVHRRDEGKSPSTRLSHPGYSLFEWKKFTESLPIKPPIQVDLAELASHSKEDDCWTAIRGKVYNVTHFLQYHPGRKAQLMRGAGIDSTILYDKVHPWVNEGGILEHCFVGHLSAGEGPKFCKFSVSSIEDVSHDTKLFILEKPPGDSFHISAGQYVRLKANIIGETVIREYTPVVNMTDSSTEQQHQLMLMIKIYSHGKMTQHLSKVKIGEPLLLSGPAGSFDAHSVCSAKTLVLIAAGSGLTPMISLLNIRYHQHSKKQSTLLIFANKREEDILWREKLEEICSTDPQKFQVLNILSSPSSSWNGASGRVTFSFLQTHLPTPCDNTRVCISGPMLFSRNVTGFLTQLNYSADSVHCFD